VEAVRNALFKSAKNKLGHPEHFGSGILQAHEALKVKPLLGLPQSKADSVSFPFLRVMTGLGIATASPREQMFNLELTQLWLLSERLQGVVADPDGTTQLPKKKIQEVMEAVIDDGRASMALRRHLANRYAAIMGGTIRRTRFNETVIPDAAQVCRKEISISLPVSRRLRVYAMDPSFSTQLGTAAINEVTLDIPWEEHLAPGPSGEYLDVTDTDASGTTYAKLNLNDPQLLAQDGWRPSEGNPAFHQQMVYAVAMKTIHHFEQALGRPVLWRHGKNPNRPTDDSKYTQRLSIRPHALRQANAFYSPETIALLFGYFEAGADDPGDHVPGTRVYTCLSHDIIAHETTHAILDGMHRRFNEPTNPDVLALHEAFADIVALMQHFTLKNLLEQQISRTRGDLEAESSLGSLAIQFGRAMGGRSGLREAIGRLDANGNWIRNRPNPADLHNTQAPHARGAILVAAVFDAFLAIYKTRTADLLRIYTAGTGVLPAGAIHPDLVARLADEAAKAAGHVLKICIRALDYLPPVDITFGEYLRGLITADFEMVENDTYNYRVAFVEAFRRRGIYPLDISTPGAESLQTLSVDTLRWQGFSLATLSPKEYKAVTAITMQYQGVVDKLKRYADDCIYLKDRHKLYKRTRLERRRLHRALKRAFATTPKFAEGLGLDPAAKFEVHEVRSALRVTADGRRTPNVIVALTQSTIIPPTKDTPSHRFHGGTTLVVDLAEEAVRYRIGKNINNANRRERTAAFVRDNSNDPLRALMFDHDRAEPFAALHALGEGTT
jgi:hypothetical protein